MVTVMIGDVWRVAAVFKMVVSAQDMLVDSAGEKDGFLIG